MTLKRFDHHGTYTCTLCGKRTRNVGGDEANLELCKACMEACERENAIADGDIDPETGKPYERVPNDH